MNSAKLLSFTAFLLFSNACVASDCYLVNGEMVCVRKMGVPNVTTIYDIQRQNKAAQQQQQIQQNQLLLQQLEIMQRLNQANDQALQSKFAALDSTAAKLTPQERSGMIAAMRELPKDQLMKLLTVMVNADEKPRLIIMRKLSDMNEKDKNDLAEILAR